jgi:UDP-N-acetylglucosamine--N-acetylmuramyl-(pentapeptide) pyrophosphoryl-undecaprenol N-acetylglucosamine transferase
MKILFTGGGTGGHFYPLVAVAEKTYEELERQHIFDADFYFMSIDPYDKQALSDLQIEFVQVPAGKMRIYFSLQNFFDLFKTAYGVLVAIYKMYKIYPDVVFSKGCYASFPALFAARILRIPVIIHESDMAPGRVTKWSARFAKRIAVSYPDLVSYFGEAKTAWTGQPVREEIMKPVKEGAYEYLKLNSETPVIYITGGSLGAQIINDCVLEALPELVKKYQIIHQAGNANFEEVKGRAEIKLHGSPLHDRYKVFPFLNTLAIKMTAGVSDLVITRAGSTLFEIATWNIPSIVIPFNKSNGDHARKNAYAYLRAGACTVIEEGNLGPSELIFAIENILDNPETYKNMQEGAKKFSRPDAATIIAQEIVQIALGHEK